MLEAFKYPITCKTAHEPKREDTSRGTGHKPERRGYRGENRQAPVFLKVNSKAQKPIHQSKSYQNFTGKIKKGVKPLLLYENFLASSSIKYKKE